MRLSIDGMDYLWNIADFGNQFFNFLLSKKYFPDFLINMTFTSFEGLFISFITRMNQSFFSERTATYSHPENKPFHFQAESTVLLSLHVMPSFY